MQLRGYQLKLIEDTKELIKNNKTDIVWAACPSSGKTFTLINFIQQHPTKKFLILTHGTTVLKDQWNKELTKHGIDCSQEIGIAQVTYGLPQSLRKDEIKQLQGIDFLIIDEAHEFTFAKTKKDKTGMVEQIISKVQPKVRIYLTGTPSKFIKAGDKYDVLCVAGLDLIKAGNISDLYIGLVTTNANIQEDDYNSEGDVNETKIQSLEDSVEGDLDNLLKATVIRLTGVFKNSPLPKRMVPKKLEGWVSVFTTLDKTMIACRSIVQATKVEAYFKKEGVSCVSSNSKNDPDSLNVKAFTDNPDIKVLVVVDRGILGFNMEDLINVVDLTCSRNIDRIYQLYARVMRKNNKNSEKFFFKFSTEENMLLSKFYMNAALCLLKEDFIMKYNGKNLNNMKIPVIIPKESREKSNKKDRKNSNNSKQLIFNPDIGFSDYVEAAKMLQEAFNKVDQELNEYAYVKFGDIKSKMFGQIVHDPETKKQQIIEWGLINKRRPSSTSKNKLEKIIGQRLNNYLKQSCETFDMNFKNKIKIMFPEWTINTVKKTQIALENGYYKLNKLPNYLNDKKLLAKHEVYHNKKSDSYQKEWSKRMKQKYPLVFESRQQKSYRKMLSLMPKFIKFKEGQEWQGMSEKYTFIDKQYGEFVGNPSSLIQTSWKNNYSGHPEHWANNVLSAKIKNNKTTKVKNIDTGQIFSTLQSAANTINQYGTNITKSIKTGGKAGGYRWAYVENGEE